MSVGTEPLSKLTCLSGKLCAEGGATIRLLSLFNIFQRVRLQWSVVWCLAIEFSYQGFQLTSISLSNVATETFQKSLTCSCTAAAAVCTHQGGRASEHVLHL